MSTWRQALLAPARVDLRLRPGRSAEAALGIYGPLRLGARVAARVNHRLRAMGLWRPIGEALPGIDDLARLLSLSPDAIATMASSTPGRVIVGFAARGALQIVAKVGGRHDAGLRREGAFVERLAAFNCRDFDVPNLRWAGEWGDRYVVAIAARRVLASATPMDALRVAIALSQPAGDGLTMTHGDFTPWNLARTPTGLLLLDWEEARTPCEPMVDLTHFVLQSGSLLGSMHPDAAIRRLTAPGDLGWQYLDATGGDPRTAHDRLVAALHRDAPGRADHRTMKYRHAMLRSLRVPAVAPDAFPR